MLWILPVGGNCSPVVASAVARAPGGPVGFPQQACDPSSSKTQAGNSCVWSSVWAILG